MNRKNPKNWTSQEKKEEILRRANLFQKAMGLHNWDITIGFENKDNEEVLATTTTSANYNRAVIKFNQLWLGDLFLLKETLDTTIIHELIHIHNAQYHRCYLDLRGAYVQTIKQLTNDRWTNVSERTTVKLANILSKEFVTK
jgi:hypothetical protein